jgi:hypothetical protein
MTMPAKTRNLREWAAGSQQFLDALVELYHDASSLAETCAVLYGDVFNKVEAERVMLVPIRRVAARARRLCGEATMPADDVRPDMILAVLRSVVGVRQALGLAAPAIPAPVRSICAPHWWRDELDPPDVGFKYLGQTDRVLRDDGAVFGSHTVLAVDDWKFEICDDGSLLGAKRK